MLETVEGGLSLGHTIIHERDWFGIVVAVCQDTWRTVVGQEWCCHMARNGCVPLVAAGLELSKLC
jgi:hypothetical protein